MACGLILAGAGAYLAWPRYAEKADSRDGPSAVSVPASERLFALEPVISDETPHLSVNLPCVNRTGKVLHITKVGHCCGVTSAKVAASELQPGQETVLRLEINVYGRFGNHIFNASVHSREGHVWPYRIRTTVYSRFRFDPPEGLRLGTVEPNARARRVAQLLIYARGTKGLPQSVAFRPNDEFT
jgi:hypothetical protein